MSLTFPCGDWNYRKKSVTRLLEFIGLCLEINWVTGVKPTLLGKTTILFSSFSRCSSQNRNRKQEASRKHQDNKNRFCEIGSVASIETHLVSCNACAEIYFVTLFKQGWRLFFSTERLEEIKGRRHTAEGSVNSLQKRKPAIQRGEKHLKHRKRKRQMGKTKSTRPIITQAGHWMQGKSIPASPPTPAAVPPY